MNFNQIEPDPTLADLVRNFWVLETEPGASPDFFHTMADGCPGLIFQPTERGIFHHPVKDGLPDLFVFGQHTSHVLFGLTGDFTTLGVSFHPHALEALFGLDAHELTDDCADLTALVGPEGGRITDRLSAAESTADKVELLNSFFRDRVAKHATELDPAVRFSLGEITATDGAVSLKELRDRLQLSERSLERKFKRSVGISPKLFARIRRFQSSLRQMQDPRVALTDVAFDQAYADQSHFIRSFKQFSGITPRQYHKRFRRLAESVVGAGS